MHRTDRLLHRPFSRWFPAKLLHVSARSASALWLTVAALSTGCTLVTDVDRSKIPAAEVIAPDPAPSMSGDGEPDAAAPAAVGDAGTDAGGGAVPDAGDAG